MHRFFLPPECIQDKQVTFPAVIAAQIWRVLRLERGEMVMVLDNAGRQYDVRLEKVDVSGVVGVVTASSAAEGETLTCLRMYCALTQREKLEWIIQKATEAGAAELCFFGARRGLVKAVEIKPAKLERWGNIAREAAEQCARGMVPPVRVLASLVDALSDATDCTLLLAGWEREDQLNLTDLMKEINQHYPLEKPLKAAVFIGPEGGFDAAEVESMRKAGVRLFSVGRRVLRVETAALLIPALILYERGGFNL